MAKLAVFTCVLFLACISQVFAFPGLHLAIGKTQTDIESVLSNVLTSSEESAEDQSAVSSVSDVSKNGIVDDANSSVSDDSSDSDDSEEDVVDATDSSVSDVSKNGIVDDANSSVSDDSSDSDDSEEDVVDATDSSVSDVSKNDIVDVADSPVSKDTGDINNGKISDTMMKLITFFRNLFKFGSSDSSGENEVSDNSETQVVEDDESSEDSEVEVTAVKIEDLEESANPDFIVDSKVTYDEVPHASESSSSEDSEPSDVLENLDETSN